MLEFFIIISVWFVIIYSLSLYILPGIQKFLARKKGQPYFDTELKIYLDDERPCPQGWVSVNNYKECIDILQTFKPSHLSLDHDLGEEKTGYDVVKWIEEETFNNINYNPPIITVHSANPAGRKNIELAIKSIEKIIINRS